MRFLKRGVMSKGLRVGFVPYRDTFSALKRIDHEERIELNDIPLMNPITTSGKANPAAVIIFTSFEMIHKFHSTKHYNNWVNSNVSGLKNFGYLDANLASDYWKDDDDDDNVGKHNEVHSLKFETSKRWIHFIKESVHVPQKGVSFPLQRL
ncbi:hypothetical protein QJS10_CPB17g01176 [Acorus calamus]|uniref:Uncharacterized protein n=1 Tax=Acorus calamus TaxID=4465 RepID=A0AAV9CW04_ACOCL|nr:hypothetical protein QJS10_CPB17g01176 [Acorus calamus]